MQVSLGNFNTNQFPTDSQLTSFIGGSKTPFTLARTAVMAKLISVGGLWWANPHCASVCRRCGADAGGDMVRAALRLVCTAALPEPGPGGRHLERRPHRSRPGICCCQRGIATHCSFYHQLCTSDDQLCTSNDQHCSSNHQHNTSDHQLCASNHQLCTSDHQPCTSNHQPCSSDHQQCASDHQLRASLSKLKRRSDPRQEGPITQPVSRGLRASRALDRHVLCACTAAGAGSSPVQAAAGRQCQSGVILPLAYQLQMGEAWLRHSRGSAHGISVGRPRR